MRHYRARCLHDKAVRQLAVPLAPASLCWARPARRNRRFRPLEW